MLVSVGLFAQQTPAPPQTTDYTIEGATAHLGTGEVIENSLLMFSKGKITFVGKAEMKIGRIWVRLMFFHMKMMLLLQTLRGMKPSAWNIN